MGGLSLFSAGVQTEIVKSVYKQTQLCRGIFDQIGCYENAKAFVTPFLHYKALKVDL